MTQNGAGAVSALVLGAGLAGAAAARALADRGVRVTVIAPDEPAASDVPVALAQPVMGKRAGFSHLRFACWETAHALLKRWDPGQRTWRTIDVFRTPPSERAHDEWAAKLEGRHPALRRARASEGPAGWCPAWSPWRLSGALLVRPRALRDLLLRGIERRHERATIPQSARDAGVDAVVVATGAAGLARWAEVASTPDAAPLWGDAALLRLPHHGLRAVIGVGAQIIPVSDHDLVVQGSHRQPPTAPGVDATALQRLLAAQRAHWPALEQARLWGAWAGARARLDSAHPLVGPIGGGVFLSTGFGPRGLLYGLPAAESLAGHVVDGAPIEACWRPRVAPEATKTTDPLSNRS